MVPSAEHFTADKRFPSPLSSLRSDDMSPGCQWLAAKIPICALSALMKRVNLPLWTTTSYDRPSIQKHPRCPFKTIRRPTLRGALRPPLLNQEVYPSRS
ncbi:hypothetical protein EYF80_036147 [Liparis tanakae]|uniref:Uncharacterized protein n=1 Tax=Liparis tanakae TaxID=230148 RepID=A0A4Z2GK22_9TELE|nr:hypothetical protein EYF80_036147 [Liparis tanakae]